MVIFIKRQQGSGSESDALSCSPSSFAETFEALHEVRGKKVETLAHCHGDPIIDDLRIARARLDRSLKTLRECTAKARQDEERYDIGHYLDDVVDELQDGAMDYVHPGWFSRRAALVLECVEDAENEEDENDAVPEPPTWSDFRALSKALGEHSNALRSLGQAEKAAAPSPVNAKAMASPPLTPQDTDHE
jgi:hypothetical protein